MSNKDEDRNLGVAGDESKTPTAASRDENVEPDATNSGPWEFVVRKLAEKARVKAVGALMVTLLPALAGIYEFGGAVGSIAQPLVGGDPREDIEAVVEGHYEAIGAGDFEKAFGFLGTRGGDEVRDRETWIEKQTKEQGFCPIEESEVKDVEVTDVEEESTAVATADVRFDYKCGESDWRFVWNVSKADGEWKLDSREEEHAASTPAPIAFGNEGRTESAVGGKTEQANLKSVKTSATADGAQDGSGNWVTYEPEKIVDGQPDTAWQVALEDDDVTYQKAVDGRRPDNAWQVAFEDGKEPWVLLEYDKPITVSRVGVIPGYSKKDPAYGTDRFYQMYTVRKARIEADGYSTEVNFEQDPEMRFVEVPNTETTFVRVKILDTYPPQEKSPGGVPYADGLFGKTAISEIEVEGA